MTALTPDAVFQGATGLELNPAPDGYVIYQTAKERVHFLNPTAAIVYELCISGKSLREIEAVLRDAFSLSQDPSAAVRDCIKSLLDEQLILPCPSS
jgi:hypothetical protein